MGNSIFKRNRIHNNDFYNIETNNNTIENEVAYIDESKINYNYSPCSICLDPISGIMLNCGHDNFCYACIETLILHNKENNIRSLCPLCREPITHVNINYNLTFNVT